MNVCLHPSRTYTAEALEKEMGLIPLPHEPEQPHQMYAQLYPELANHFGYSSPHGLRGGNTIGDEKRRVRTLGSRRL